MRLFVITCEFDITYARIMYDTLFIIICTYFFPTPYSFFYHSFISLLIIITTNNFLYSLLSSFIFLPFLIPNISSSSKLRSIYTSFIQMDFHGFAEHALELRLSTTSPVAENTMNPIKKPSPNSDHCLEPSLTLALSGDSCGGSSFSIASAKREREVPSEESERGGENTSGEEDEDGGVNGKKKLRLTKAQSGLLEEAFKIHTTLNPKQKQELARDLKLRPRQVEVWFQNRRARTKLKQTEVDCEYLKRCCKTLTDENQRLRQEVQELKAQKVSPPLYMQLPTTTLTVCPSCEQIGDTKSATSKNPCTKKPYFFNPFTSSSAAC
ncbi:putative transcription factor homeobox-WOX family [Helianthus debilis subsp. tardiflorus]